MVVYADKEDVLKGNRAKSDRVQLLNGDWKFNWVADPAQRPVDFYKNSVTARHFKLVSLSEVNGHKFTNVCEINILVDLLGNTAPKP